MPTTKEKAKTGWFTPPAPTLASIHDALDPYLISDELRAMLTHVLLDLPEDICERVTDEVMFIGDVEDGTYGQMISGPDPSLMFRPLDFELELRSRECLVV